MELIAILFFLGIYLLVSIGVIKAAMAWAKWQERRRWLWGGLAGFLMYNLIFWDWLPTMIAYKYYCDTQAGFTVFKTPEQWKNDNPNLTNESLKPLIENQKISMPFKSLPTNPTRKVQMLNPRIYHGLESDLPVLPILPLYKNIYYFSDILNDKRLAEFVSFSIDYHPNDFGNIKFWMRGNFCGHQSMANEMQETGYTSYFKKIIEMEY